MTDDDLDEGAGLEGAVRFGGPPSAKARLAAQRAVNALFDALAPDNAAPRATGTAPGVERYHTPNGVVLQAPTAAVSVSWFPDTASELELGELQLLLWRGVVQRRGAAPRRERAEVVRERVFRPVEVAPESFEWRDADGVGYTSPALAEHCLELLAAQGGAAV
jgi:hypothetical protein